MPIEMEQDRQISGGGAAVAVHYAYVARHQYTATVVESDNRLRVAPGSDRYQTAGGVVVATDPPGSQVSYTDRLGNRVHRVRVTSPHRTLVIAAAGAAQLAVVPPAVSDVPLPLSLSPYPDAGGVADAGVVDAEFLQASPLVNPESVREAAGVASAGAVTLLDAVRRIMGWIEQQVRYQPGVTSVHSTAVEVLTTMAGVCQDKAHLALGMLRALGVPARYASGLLTRQPGETHAWVEFRHPAAGWLPADPTRGVVIDTATDYLKFAVGRDYTDALPVDGSFVSGGQGRLDFVTAQVFFDRSEIGIADAMELLAGDSGLRRNDGENHIGMTVGFDDAA